MPQIVTVTFTLSVDKSCSTDQVVAERKLRCSEPTYHPGGGGINVARVVTELGGEVAAYWPCGGASGELLRQLLEEEGIEHYPIEIRAMTRENLIVFEQSSEQQFRFGLPGATLTVEEIQSFLEVMRAEERRRKTFPKRVLPVSRRPTEISRAKMTCSKPVGSAMPRCLPTVRSRIGKNTTSATLTSPSQLACRKWCERTASFEMCIKATRPGGTISNVGYHGEGTNGHGRGQGSQRHGDH